MTKYLVSSKQICFLVTACLFVGVLTVNSMQDDLIAQLCFMIMPELLELYSRYHIQTKMLHFNKFLTNISMRYSLVFFAWGECWLITLWLGQGRRS